jgi:alpha-tubulin suppressor-like RCC1 family protein
LPVALNQLSNVIDVAAGTRFTCALSANGNAIQCWGDNTSSQLGELAVPFSTEPVSLPTTP